LYFEENFQMGKRRLAVSFSHSLKAGFEPGQVRHFTKFYPGSRAIAESDGERLPYLPRQRFKLVRDPYRLFQAPKIE
jgi:hypothetical protein